MVVLLNSSNRRPGRTEGRWWWSRSQGGTGTALLLLLSFVFQSVAVAASTVNVGTWVKLAPAPLSASDQTIACTSISHAHIPPPVSFSLLLLFAARVFVDHLSGQPPTTCDHFTVDIGNGRLLSGFGSSSNDPTTFLDFQELWTLDTTLDPPQWSITPQTGQPSTPRYAVQAAYDRTAQRLIVFGGSHEDSTLIDDVLSFDMATNTWSVVTPASPDGVSNAGPVGRGWTDLVS